MNTKIRNFTPLVTARLVIITLEEKSVQLLVSTQKEYFAQEILQGMLLEVVLSKKKALKVGEVSSMAAFEHKSC